MILALALYPACSDPVPINLRTPTDDENDIELVDEAIALLGLDAWELVDRRRCVINLTLLDVEPQGGAQTYFKSRTIAHISVGRKLRSVAHELGHGLSLLHTCDPPDADSEEVAPRECEASDRASLMHGMTEDDTLDGFELSDDELESIEDARRKFAGCR